VAKKILVGKPLGELGEEAGSQIPLVWHGKEIGRVIRSKTRCNPLYVAPGHKVSMQSAADWVKRCLRGYRLPEPTRQAHLASNEYRRQQAGYPVA